MNYKKTLESIVLKRKEKLASVAEIYAEAIRLDSRLYAIEKELRRLALDEINGLAVDNERVRRLEKQKTDILAEKGITKDFLSPPPECSRCGDTGLIGGKFCECVRRQAIANDDNIALKVHTFADSDPAIQKEQGLDVLYQHLKVFVNKFPKTNIKNIVLMGATGTGKTFTASVIAGEILNRGFSVVFLTAFGLLSRMLNYHTTFDHTKEEGFLPLLDCDLLVIDDLGTESMLKNVTKEYLYIIINERTLKSRHTVITTNLPISQIDDRYGEKIGSRLLDKSICLLKNIDGKDLRKNR